MSLRTRLHRHRLDEELAAGADPNRDPLRLERARELIGESWRRRVAASLERAIDEAETEPRYFSSKIPVARKAIHESRADLEDVASRLASPDVNPQGVAKLMLLLTEGTSPLYAGGTTTQLRWKLAEASEGIEHGPPAMVGPFSPTARERGRWR